MMALRSAAVSGLTLVLLAACSSKPEPTPQPTSYEGTAEEAPVEKPAPPPPPSPVAPAVEAQPAPTLTTESNFVEPAEEPVDPSDQTLEDADATGLTTRAKRDGEERADPVGEGSKGE
jgi:hypothetical protein